MASDLDEKLLDAIREAQGYIDDEDIQLEAANVAIEQIKQAFKDAGYERISEGTIPTFKSYLKQVTTGQEWYDRFEKEWGTWPEKDCCNPGSSCEDQTRIDMQRGALEAAKKAAGVE